MSNTRIVLFSLLLITMPTPSIVRADFPEVIRQIDRYYGHVDYSLTSLFTDDQRRIVKMILNSTLWNIENALTTIYEDHASLLHYLSQAGLPKPPALALAAGFAVNAGLRRARVARVQRTARQNGKIYHLGGAAALARDLFIRAIGPRRMLARQDWIYDWRA